MTLSNMPIFHHKNDRINKKITKKGGSNRSNIDWGLDKL